MPTLKHFYKHLFMTPATALDLGISRFLFFTGLFFFEFFNFLGPTIWMSLDTLLWAPVSLFSVFSQPPLTYQQAQWVDITFKISLALSAIGLFTRVSTKVACASAMTLWGLRMCYGEVTHQYPPVAMALLIFAFSKCGDNFSIDQKILKKSFSREESSDYGWPIKTLLFVFISMYFCSGFSKIYVSGLDWFDPMHISRILIYADFTNEINAIGQKLRWGYELAQYPEVASGLAVFTITLELLTPLAFINKGWRILTQFIIACMHVGFATLLSNGFFELICFHLALFPWRWVYLKSKRH